MERISKAIMRAFGAKPNGTPQTSCVNDALHVKQIIMLVTLSFSLGAMAFGFKGLPERVSRVEEKVIRIESITTESMGSIDRRLARIENALIRR